MQSVFDPCHRSTVVETSRSRQPNRGISDHDCISSQKSQPLTVFTGKGGVGKTLLSCAAALSLVDQGRRVLLVSTDPASNLDEMLGAELSDRAAAIPAMANLFAMNILCEHAPLDTDDSSIYFQPVGNK